MTPNTRPCPGPWKDPLPEHRRKSGKNGIRKVHSGHHTRLTGNCSGPGSQVRLGLSSLGTTKPAMENQCSVRRARYWDSMLAGSHEPYVRTAQERAFTWMPSCRVTSRAFMYSCTVLFSAAKEKTVLTWLMACTSKQPTSDKI